MSNRRKIEWVIYGGGLALMVLTIAIKSEAYLFPVALILLLCLMHPNETIKPIWRKIRGDSK